MKRVKIFGCAALILAAAAGFGSCNNGAYYSVEGTSWTLLVEGGTAVTDSGGGDLSPPPPVIYDRDAGEGKWKGVVYTAEFLDSGVLKVTETIYDGKGTDSSHITSAALNGTWRVTKDERNTITGEISLTINSILSKAVFRVDVYAHTLTLHSSDVVSGWDAGSNPLYSESYDPAYLGALEQFAANPAIFRMAAKTFKQNASAKPAGY